MPETATIASPRATYSRDEVRRMLTVTERQLRQWEKHDLIRAGEEFTLPDLIALRTLKQLTKDKIAPSKIRLALSALRRRLREVEDPLRELKVIAVGRKIRVEVQGHQMESMSGQLLFNFDGAELRRLLSFPGSGGGSGAGAAPSRKKSPQDLQKDREEAEKWFQKGLALERGGQPKEAIEAYERAVGLDPNSAGAWVNLGTIYLQKQESAKAESYYRRALEVDPGYPLAHFNIGNLFDERGDYDRAQEHYLEAIRLNPVYADAHYNLALLYQGGGQIMEAVRHWKTYLRLDPGSAWASIARRELDKLKKSTVVRTPANRRHGGLRILD